NKANEKKSKNLRPGFAIWTDLHPRSTLVTCGQDSLKHDKDSGELWRLGHKALLSCLTLWLFDGDYGRRAVARTSPIIRDVATVARHARRAASVHPAGAPKLLPFFKRSLQRRPYGAGEGWVPWGPFLGPYLIVYGNT